MRNVVDDGVIALHNPPLDWIGAFGFLEKWVCCLVLWLFVRVFSVKQLCFPTFFCC